MDKERKEVLSLLLTSVLTICAVIVTGLVIKQEVFDSGTSDSDSALASLTEAEWRAVLDGEPQANAEESQVIIVNFYDYQCPFCHRVEAVLERIQQRYPRRVKIIHRHLPLAIHPRAYQAALAVECANEQGAFSAYHASLFNNQSVLEKIDLDSLADSTPAIRDIESFGKCLRDERVAYRVDSDMEMASDLGFSSTPTLVVNRTVIPGAVTFERLDSIVQEALEDKT